MPSLSELQQEFEIIVATRGFLTKDDYTCICAGIDDTDLLDTVAGWIIESELPLAYQHKNAVGPQYQQELLRKVKNPNVNDVKDTKHRTHKNKDKFQECKKKVVEKDGSFHLNKLIENLKEYENEFLPPWKKFDSEKPEAQKTASEKLRVFLDSNKDVVDLLAEQRVLAQTEHPPESTQEPAKDAEFSEADMSAPGLDLAASLHGKVVRVTFEGCPEFVAAIADTNDKKVAGLEPYESLKEREGLYFPFKESDSVTFHMGKVKFPIDIVFLMEQPNCMEIGKVVEYAEPGTSEQWNAKKVKAVLEVAGGTCKRLGLTVGSQCTVSQLTLKGQ